MIKFIKMQGLGNDYLYINCINNREPLFPEELAKRLNLSSSASISQYESGDRIPSDDIKLKMCELFNCSLDYLMGKSDIRKPEIEEDPLGLAKIGFSMKDYNPPTDKQREQLAELIKVVLKDNKKEKEEK